MPRKAPDKVIEHRISLSNYERDRVDQLLRLHRNNSITRNVTNGVGVVGLPMLGVAALIWAGFSLTDLVDRTKTWAQKVADPISDYLTQSGLFFNYTADEIGRAIQENEDRKMKLAEEYQEWLQDGPNDGDKYDEYFYSGKGEMYRQKLQAYTDREVVLRKMLNDISTGKNTGIGWISTAHSKTSQEAFLSDTYDEYYSTLEEEGALSRGGPAAPEYLPPIDWEIQED